MEEDRFRRELTAFMTEFIGSSESRKFVAKGEQAHLIADSHIDVDDQPDFWKKLHERFPIKAPWANDPKPTTTVGRMREAFFPRAIYELPDITIGELRRVVEDGAWPEGAVTRSTAKAG